jgi:DNA-binding HxlR family transcriptional regulator
VIYRLTEKGINLAPVLVEMTVWGRETGRPTHHRPSFGA